MDKDTAANIELLRVRKEAMSMSEDRRGLQLLILERALLVCAGCATHPWCAAVQMCMMGVRLPSSELQSLAGENRIPRIGGTAQALQSTVISESQGFGI